MPYTTPEGKFERSNKSLGHPMEIITLNRIVRFGAAHYVIRSRAMITVQLFTSPFEGVPRLEFASGVE